MKGPSSLNTNRGLLHVAVSPYLRWSTLGIEQTRN